MEMHSPFNPPGIEFHPVSKKLIPVRLIEACPVPIIGIAILALVPMPLWLLVLLAAVLAIVCIWGGWLLVRQVHFMAWGKTEHDVYSRTGRFYQTIVCAPFGRMQYIDVTSGPLERLFGLATLRMYTASPSGHCHIAGLTMDVAAQLRSDFSDHARQELAGL